MTTSIKSESIICHIWNTTVLLTGQFCVKTALRGGEKKKTPQKMPAGVPGTFTDHEVQTQEINGESINLARTSDRIF